MREKLIELIASKVCDTYSEACEEWLPHDCGKCYANNCHIAEIADHLIANGVTFATDNNVGSRWIPVTERLPEEHKLVLCLWIQMGDGFRYGFARLQRENVWWVLNEGMPEVTHWMPLPEAPKEVE